MQLINVLGQVVAEPVLYGASPTSSTPFPAVLKGARVRHLSLACGDYVAYWDGKTPRGREAASGVLGQVLAIDGEQQDTRRIFYKK